MGSYIHQSRLINDSFDCEFINLTTQSNIQDTGKSSIKKLFAFARLYYTIVKTLLKRRFSLSYVTINSSGPGFYKEMIIVLILKCFHQNIVYHYHNKGVKENSTGWLNRILYKFQFHCSRAILISSELYYDLAGYLKPDHVYYCNNGIAGLPINQISYSKKDTAPVALLFVSNMWIAKGVYVLLEACRILAEKGTAFICNFVGAWTPDITEAAFNKVCVDYGIAENVKAHGSKLNGEKFDFFLSSDIFVFPTLNDVFPLVNLEAMQCGLPIISSDEGAIGQIVLDGHNGFIVPKGDPEVLADKMMILMRDENLRNQMGLNGKQRYNELFTMSSFERNFKSTLLQVVSDFNR